MKDQVILNKNLKEIEEKCFICEDVDHVSYNCNRVHLFCDS